MIPVFQDRFGGDSSPEGGGNCAWACVASILELDFAEVRHLPPPSGADLMQWTREQRPDLEFTNVNLRYGYQTVPGPPGIASWDGPHAFERWHYSVRDEFEAPESDFDAWMATIHSPGLASTADDPYFPMPQLHAVVFSGRELAHDPNPAYECPRRTPQVLEMSWWTRV